MEHIPLLTGEPTLRSYTYHNHPMQLSMHRGENSYFHFTIKCAKAVKMNLNFKPNCEIDVKLEEDGLSGDVTITKNLLWVNMTRVANINWATFVKEKMAEFPSDVVILTATGMSVPERKVRDMLAAAGMVVIKEKKYLNIDHGYFLAGKLVMPNEGNKMEIMVLGDK